MRIATMLTACALACGTVQASEWVIVSESSKENRDFVDTSSIRVTEHIRRAWTKQMFPHHSRKDELYKSRKWEHYWLQRNACDCENESARTESVTVYYEDGTHATLPYDDSPEPWHPVPPDTFLSDEMKLICSWKSK
jgi:hypothetical protein